MSFKPIGIDTCDVCHNYPCLVAVSVHRTGKGGLNWKLKCKNCFTIRDVLEYSQENRCNWCKMVIDESPSSYEEKIIKVGVMEYYHYSCNLRRSNKLTAQTNRKYYFQKISPKIIQWIGITSSIATIVTLYIFMNNSSNLN